VEKILAGIFFFSREVFFLADKEKTAKIVKIRTCKNLVPHGSYPMLKFLSKTHNNNPLPLIYYEFLPKWHIFQSENGPHFLYLWDKQERSNIQWSERFCPARLSVALVS